jgi:hypothetical protein
MNSGEWRYRPRLMAGINIGMVNAWLSEVVLKSYVDRFVVEFDCRGACVCCENHANLFVVCNVQIVGGCKVLGMRDGRQSS